MKGESDIYSCIGAYNPSGLIPTRLIPVFAKMGECGEENFYHQAIDQHGRIEAFTLIPGIDRMEIEAQISSRYETNRGFAVGGFHLRAFAISRRHAVFFEYDDSLEIKEFLTYFLETTFSYRNPIMTVDIAKCCRIEGNIEELVCADILAMKEEMLSLLSHHHVGYAPVDTATVVPQTVDRIDRTILYPFWLDCRDVEQIEELWEAMDDILEPWMAPVITKIDPPTVLSGILIQASSNTLDVRTLNNTDDNYANTNDLKVRNFHEIAYILSEIFRSDTAISIMDTLIIIERAKENLETLRHFLKPARHICSMCYGDELEFQVNWFFCKACGTRIDLIVDAENSIHPKRRGWWSFGRS